MVRFRGLHRADFAAIAAACAIAGTASFNCYCESVRLPSAEPAIRLSLVADTSQPSNGGNWLSDLKFGDEPEGQLNDNGSRLVFKTADLRAQAQEVEEAPAPPAIQPKPVFAPQVEVTLPGAVAAPKVDVAPVAAAPVAAAPIVAAPNSISIKIVAAPVAPEAPIAGAGTVAVSKSSSIGWAAEVATSPTANSSPGGSVVPVIKMPPIENPTASSAKAESVATEPPPQAVKQPAESAVVQPQVPEAPRAVVQTTVEQRPTVQSTPVQSTVVQTPIPEAPRIVVQAPIEQRPAVQTPMPEAPQPVAQLPIAQTPTIQSPIVQAPVVQSPAPEVQQPMVQAPMAPSPVEPAPEPVVQTTVAPRPIMSRPVVQAPVMQSPVMPAPKLRTLAMEQMAKQADGQIRHGFELANRGGYFAARAEFISALRLVSQALDGEEQTNSHSESLAAALTAMKEAQDFIPTGSKVEANLDLAGIIGSHTTPVLKQVNAAELSPMLALKHYHTYAQDQLALSVEHEVAGSMALYALAKVYAMLSSEGSSDIPVAEPKAIVCYHAALMVCSQNYMAANDLGTLLARDGDYPDARQMLEHSVMTRCCSSNLANLARVYEQLGERDLAAKANDKAKYAAYLESARLKQVQGSSTAEVRWVDPGTLAQSADGGAYPGQPVRSPTANQDKPTLGMRPQNDQQNIQR